MPYLVLSVSLKPVEQKLPIHPHGPICLAGQGGGQQDTSRWALARQPGKPGKHTEFHHLVCDNPAPRGPRRPQVWLGLMVLCRL